MRIFTSFLVLTLTSTVLFAADPTGTIVGRVLDPTGAAVVDARIAATAPTTGMSRQTTSASDGGYVFPLMPVGAYTLTVEVSGFRRSDYWYRKL
jgi:hypothetical protein